MRTRITSALTLLALLAAACQIETSGEDPAEMEPVDEMPGDVEGA